MESVGFVGRQDAHLLRAIIAAMRTREARTRYEYYQPAKANLGLQENAVRASTLPQNKLPLPLKSQRRVKVTGAALKEMTQSTALPYKLVRERKMSIIMYIPRRRTVALVRRVRRELRVAMGYEATERELWRALRHKDITRSARYFLWMSMHDAYMIGTNWLRENFSEDIKARSQCRECGVIEDMHHILFECSAVGQEVVWNVARDLTLQRGLRWYTPSLGTVIGGALGMSHAGRSAKLKSEKARAQAASRFYRIIMTESAHLIWKLRCQRVIPEDGVEDTDELKDARLFTLNEVHNRVVAALNMRLEADRVSTHERYGKHALSKDLVLSTWSGCLLEEHRLPADWIYEPGVLVGIRQRSGEG